MLKILALITILITPALSYAERKYKSYGGYEYQQPTSGHKYDWQTGNTYNWNTNSQGDTKVRGYNANTGSNWNTTIKENGNMSGFDSNNNYWNYNKRSGTYINYGTGEFRTKYDRLYSE